MGVLDGGGDHRRERGSFGVNLGRPIVTNGAFATRSSQITLRTCFVLLRPVRAAPIVVHVRANVPFRKTTH